MGVSVGEVVVSELGGLKWRLEDDVVVWEWECLREDGGEVDSRGEGVVVGLER